MRRRSVQLAAPFDSPLVPLPDPFHFRSIPISMLSLFRASTLEDWTDIMYINIYGCNKYSSGVYYVKSSYR